MSASRKVATEFFVGYAPPPRGIGRFVFAAAAAFLAAAFVFAFALAWSVQERGGGGFGGGLKLQGRVANAPYPVLQIFPSARYPSGHVMLIAGGGKQGMGPAVAKLEGKALEVSGFLLKRGDIDVIVTDTRGHYKVLEETAKLPALQPVSMGRWRIAGEICDGKCYAGVMRPGRGIAHKACANLCIAGDQPAVFATVRPFSGASFMLLADADGKLPPKILYDYVALPVELEGEVMKYGDLFVFRADWSSIRRQ
ncbi:MAG: hypothetical protein AB7F96_01375 [Beijerinckiaceae bacterium]